MQIIVQGIQGNVTKAINKAINTKVDDMIRESIENKVQVILLKKMHRWEEMKAETLMEKGIERYLSRYSIKCLLKMIKAQL